MRPTSYAHNPNERPNWSIIKTLLPYLFEFRWRVIGACILLVCAKLATVAAPWLLKLIVDSLDGSAQLVAVPVLLLSTYGFLRFMSSFLSEMRDTVFARVTERAMSRIALKVFQHLHSLDLDFHQERKTGGLSRDIERGTSGISFLLRFLVFNIIPTLLELFMVLVILWGVFSWEYCLVVLVSILTYVIFSIKTTEWRSKHVRKANELDSRANTRAVDSLLNFETVKYFNNEQYEATQYNEGLSLWEQARIRNRLSLSLLNSGQALIIAVFMTTLLLMTSFDVASQKYSVGDFVMINAYMIQLFMPLNFLGFVYREIRQALIDIEKMFGLLNVNSKVKEKPQACELVVSDGMDCSIEFDNVRFSYNSNREILKGVSFSIKPGETLALVGASGAGKSTIAKLMFRFYDPDFGSIKINGIDIRDVTLASLRRHIGVVPQDTVLFNNSIAYNIAYGNPEASQEELVKAAGQAHLTSFINSLPEGMETLVGERGLKVSGGEKQRIAIARVLLKNPPILLFDEATSSLDTEAERHITRELYDMAVRHCTLTIAHRLSTVARADKIIVLHEGEVVESGRHDELIAENGYYAQLWLAQSRQKQSELG